MKQFALGWSHGDALVLSTAAMLAECRFDLGGEDFRPFARAPWMGQVSNPAIIGHLRELGGDFACLPFGAGPPQPIGPPEWAELMGEPPLGPIHGPAGDAEWELVARTEHSVTVGLDYPAHSLVRRLERRVGGQPGSPVLESSLTIYPRRSGAVSVGLHPILRLPEKPVQLQLEAEFEFGLVHPRQVGAGEAQEFSALAAVPHRGGHIDLSHVPLGEPNFSVQLCGMRGPLRAVFLEEGAGVEIDWDRDLLPSLQIWCTDGGIEGEPWQGRYRGIGLEPIASAFDLNTRLSERPNPISRRGVATAVQLQADTPLTLSHTVSAFATGSTAAGGG